MKSVPGVAAIQTLLDVVEGDDDVIQLTRHLLGGHASTIESIQERTRELRKIVARAHDAEAIAADTRLMFADDHRGRRYNYSDRPGARERCARCDCSLRAEGESINMVALPPRRAGYRYSMTPPNRVPFCVPCGLDDHFEWRESLS